MTRVIITGARNWYPIKIARAIVGRLKSRYDDLVLVIGDCRTRHGSVDMAFEKAAIEAGLTPEIHAADWDKFELKAGPIRNGEMIKAGAKFVIAVHKSLSWSKGTKDCVKQARQAKIPVYLIDNNEGNARRFNG